MSKSDYPRDLAGYGADPPDPAWPGGARIAVQFVINYEEGGENCILHGDTASEAFLSEIVGAVPYDGMRHLSMESIYEYGARAGFWRLHRLFTDRAIPGWASTVLPLGFYQGRSSPNTLKLIREEGGFVYSADSYADDLPYVDRESGLLMVPYTLDANDMRFATPQGFNSGDQFFTYLKDSFDQLYTEGGRMLSVGLHGRLAGRPGRAAALARFLDYVAGHDDAWIARRIDIARHWQARFPDGAA